MIQSYMTFQRYFRFISIFVMSSVVSCDHSKDSGEFSSEGVIWTREWGSGASGAYSTIHFARHLDHRLLPGPFVGGSNLVVKFERRTSVSPAYAVVKSGGSAARLEILPLPLSPDDTASGGFRVVRRGELIIEFPSDNP